MASYLKIQMQCTPSLYPFKYQFILFISINDSKITFCLIAFKKVRSPDFNLIYCLDQRWYENRHINLNLQNSPLY
jgi:hypothetical protein